MQFVVLFPKLFQNKETNLTVLCTINKFCLKSIPVSIFFPFSAHCVPKLWKYKFSLVWKDIPSTYRIGPSMQKHDKIFRPGISVLDFTFVAVWINREFRNVESLIGFFYAGLRSYRHFVLRGHGGRFGGWFARGPNVVKLHTTPNCAKKLQI